MNLTRYNYEEYFMLYVDNELSATEKIAVENFVAQNPDLAAELAMLQQTVLNPNETINYPGISNLLQPEENGFVINETNFEEQFIAYTDDELNNLEKELVEMFVYKHPQHQQAFELFHEIKYTPDNNIHFPNKTSLYRYEKKERVVHITWLRFAAAAVIILLAAIVWLNNSGKKTGTNTAQPALVKNEDKNTGVQPNKSIQVPVTILPKNTLNNEKKNSNNTGKKNNVNNSSEDVTEKEILAATKIKSNKLVTQQKLPGINRVKEKEMITANKIQPVNLPVIETKNDVAKIDVVKEPVIDKPMPIVTNEIPNVQYASNNNAANTIYVGNTAISKKNSLRGFFRKASRVIGRNVNVGSGDNKGILIGGFTIAAK
jgi:hypothetical protein